MVIVLLVDLHGSDRYLDAARSELARADLVLVGGDITNFGRRREAQAMIERIRAVNPAILAVAGNCDHPDVERYLEDEDIHLDGASRTAGELLIVGLGGSLPGPMGTPNTRSEEQLAAALERAAQHVAEPFILLSHEPPFDTKADVVRGGRHVGSRSVRAFIERRKPLACFSGHIHESECLDRLGMTQIVNPGPFMHGKLARVVVGPNGAVEVAKLAL